MTRLAAIDDFTARAAHKGWPIACEPALRFDAEELNGLLAVWNGVRGHRVLPQRRDFSARALARNLRNISFIERKADGRYRFGYFGSGLAARTGDLTGKFVDEVVAPEIAAAWRATFDTALAAAAPLRYVSRIRAFELDYLTAESLVAPLAGDDGHPGAVLVSTVYSAAVAARNTQ